MIRSVADPGFAKKEGGGGKLRVYRGFKMAMLLLLAKPHVS